MEERRKCHKLVTFPQPFHMNLAAEEAASHLYMAPADATEHPRHR